MHTLITYILVAIIATIANLGSQELIFQCWSWPFAVQASMLFGTGIGLVVKYVLDKKYVFNFKTESLLSNSKNFFIYSSLGAFTTAIFWFFETIFYFAFNDINLRYCGAVIGLAMGYLLKYQLDKRFVFRKERPS